MRCIRRPLPALSGGCAGSRTDVTVYGMEDKQRIHVVCGGVVVAESDCITGDGDEIWWNYRCTKCRETFRTVNEFTEDL